MVQLGEHLIAQPCVGITSELPEIERRSHNEVTANSRRASYGVVTKIIVDPQWTQSEETANSQRLHNELIPKSQQTHGGLSTNAHPTHNDSGGAHIGSTAILLCTHEALHRVDPDPAHRDPRGQ